MSLENLRELLGARIGQNTDLKTHAAALDDIAKVEAHSVKLVEPAPVPAEDDFNCVIDALDLSLEQATSPSGRYHADLSFLQNLIDTNILIASEADFAEGDLAVYFLEGRVKHVGTALRGRRIRSKWGCGHVYEHRLLEVPASYGNEIRWYRPIDPDLAYEQLRQFRRWM